MQNRKTETHGMDNRITGNYSERKRKKPFPFHQYFHKDFKEFHALNYIEENKDAMIKFQIFELISFYKCNE
uniref:Uncharacterized protein n=1 Tax=Onchocerca volvulus TaxID=6282 RepID=A0A8R1XUK7_ONCVO